MKLADYVLTHTIRGACMCGRCCDAPPEPEKKQPAGHTVDLHFFKVSAFNNPNKEEFVELVNKEFPLWMDGKEHNYIECGGDMGDQGLTMQTFGLGVLLGVWNLSSPDTIMPFLPQAEKDIMCGLGMIAIQVPTGEVVHGSTST